MNQEKLPKIFNIIFFVNTSKTRHFKLRYFFVKSFAILLSIYFVFSVVLIFEFLKQREKIEYLDDYIVKIKESALNEFLTNHFQSLSEPRGQATSETKSVENHENFKFNDSNNALPVNLEEEFSDVPKSQIDTDVSHLSNENIAAESKSNDLLLNKFSHQFKDSHLNIKFTLIKNDAGKKAISGVLCGIFVASENNAFTFPKNLPLSNGIPISCEGGEKFKLNRQKEFSFSFKDVSYLKNKAEIFIFYQMDGKNQNVELIYNGKL